MYDNLWLSDPKYFVCGTLFWITVKTSFILTWLISHSHCCHCKFIDRLIISLQSPDIEYQSPNAAVTRTRGLLPVLPPREIENPFHMLLASQLECVDCKYRHPVRYDLNDSLSLSFPKTAWVKSSCPTANVWQNFYGNIP